MKFLKQIGKNIMKIFYMIYRIFVALKNVIVFILNILCCCVRIVVYVVALACIMYGIHELVITYKTYYYEKSWDIMPSVLITIAYGALIVFIGLVIACILSIVWAGAIFLSYWLYEYNVILKWIGNKWWMFKRNAMSDKLTKKIKRKDKSMEEEAYRKAIYDKINNDTKWHNSTWSFKEEESNANTRTNYNTNAGSTYRYSYRKASQSSKNTHNNSYSSNQTYNSNNTYNNSTYNNSNNNQTYNRYNNTYNNTKNAYDNSYNKSSDTDERKESNKNKSELDKALELFNFSSINFSLKELKRKRNCLMQVYHTDINDSKEAEEMTKKINGYYDLLKKYAKIE